MSAPPDLKPGLFAGRYKVERVIGQGATATVHLARDTERGITVAIKLLRHELAHSVATDRFLKEIRRTSGLQHPNILPVLDSGEYEGRPYFALPYMEGGTLRTLLKREHQLELAEAIRITRTVGEALDYAHARGLIHRDVKPENILFTNGQACLGDFGIAKALEVVYGDGTTSTSGTIRGTPAYMSPEQASGAKDYDGRSDIYSLACVFYEMVTGMQAFIGPTPESVIAQRFTFTPREIRVYRPTAPAGLDEVLAKAFAMAPADRYRTCLEMVRAIELTAKQSLNSASAEPPRAERGTQRRRANQFLIGAGLVAFGAALVMLIGFSIRKPGIAAIHLDTTRLVILPLERMDSSEVPWRDDDLLQQAFARWRDVEVVDQFQLADAIRTRGQARTSDEAAALAASLGAGRYVRALITPLGDHWRVNASIYDAAQRRPLYQNSRVIQNELTAATAAYASLADSLLLRGGAGDSVPTHSAATRSLPAVQAFGRAQAALDEWDLVRADSGLQAAVAFDPSYARASLWLAQVRAWQGLSRNTWATAAERALGNSHQLTEREKRLAGALVRLARGSYGEACALYENLIRKNDRDFAAWFGLGQCHHLDHTVVKDSRSPSGWRLRSSARAAMDAYSTAFELLPAVHRGYERGAFGRLRLTLLVSTGITIGYGESDSAVFYARPGWIGDTLVLVPYPWQMVARGDPDAIPPGFSKALAMRRDAFRKTAARWSAAYPTSSGAKHAVAVALELLGDASAIDTVRLARRLESDPQRRLQLAATEVLLLVKFGLPDRQDWLAGAAALADSILRTAGAGSTSEALLMTEIAMLIGACDAAERFARSVPLRPWQRVSAEFFSQSQAVLARLAMGCSAQGYSVRQLIGDLDREYRGRSADDRARALEEFISRAALLDREYDPAVLDAIAAATSDSLIAAASELAKGNRDSARRLFLSIRDAPPDTVVGSTPDITLAQVRIALAVGDTTWAIQRLEIMLAHVRMFDPDVLKENMRTGPLVRCAMLRADIAAASGDRNTARRWGRAAATLLASADADLRSDVRRMSTYAAFPNR